MSTEVKLKKSVIQGNGDQLFNYLAYLYLKNIQNIAIKLILNHIFTLQNNRELHQALTAISALNSYDHTAKYHNLYRDLLLGLQNHDTKRYIKEKKFNKKQLELLDELFLALYENNNHALKLSYLWLESKLNISNCSLITLSDTQIMKLIKKFAKGNKQQRSNSPNNFTSPSKNGANLSNINSVFGAIYKPMIEGSLPTIREYAYKKNNHQRCPKELRFGTQVQVGISYEVNPLFELYLNAKQRQTIKTTTSTDNITHIYFNALRRGGGVAERRREGLFTDLLQNLEQRHTNIAVITLPADGGLLDHKHINDQRPVLSKRLALKEIYLTAMRNEQDFYISSKIREQANIDSKTIKKLLANTLLTLGIDHDDPMISPATRHAIMFHFVKYELTNHIIETFGPESINFSCKDAIDRGGVHSLYYNFIKSLQLGIPLSQKEFIQGIHAAPTYVKGRGMNHHTSMLWNAINHYCAQQKNVPEWLQQWINVNKPNTRSSVKTTQFEGLNYDFAAKSKRKHHELNFKGEKFSSVKSFILHIASNLLSLFKKTISYLALDKSLTETDNPSKNLKNSKDTLASLSKPMTLGYNNTVSSRSTRIQLFEEKKPKVSFKPPHSKI